MRQVEAAGVSAPFDPNLTSPENPDHYLNYWAKFARDNPNFAEQATTLDEELNSARLFLAELVTRPTNPHSFTDVNKFHRIIGPGDQPGILADSLALYGLVVKSAEIRTQPTVHHLLAGNLLFDAALDPEASTNDKLQLLSKSSEHYRKIYNPDKQQRKNRYRQLAERLDVSAQTLGTFYESAEKGANLRRRRAFMTAHKQHVRSFLDLVDQELCKRKPDYGFIAEWYGELVFRDQIWWTRSVGAYAIRTALWREDEPLGHAHADLPRYSYDYQVYEVDENGEIESKRKQLKTRKIRDDGRHIKHGNSYIDGVDQVVIYYEDGRSMAKMMHGEATDMLKRYKTEKQISTTNVMSNMGAVAMELAA